MHNARYAAQSRAGRANQQQKKASLPLTVCLCVIHPGLTGHNEKIPRMFYACAPCLTRFHGDLCAAHFLTSFHFLAFPLKDQSSLCPFLITAWSRREDGADQESGSNSLRCMHPCYCSISENCEQKLHSSAHSYIPSASAPTPPHPTR